MTVEEMKKINASNYSTTEHGLREECRDIIKLAKEISASVDRPIYFVKGN